MSGAGLEPLSKRLLAVAAALSVLLIVLVVFAWQHGNDEVSFNPIAQAAARTQSQPGARIAISGSYLLPNGKAIAFHGHGVYNGRTKLSRQAIEIAVPAPIGSVRMEAVGGTQMMYLRSKLLAPELPPGVRWLAVQPGLGGAGQAAMADNTGSEGQLEMLRAAGGDVKSLGTEDVRGVETTLYSATVDIGSHAQRLAEEGKKAAAHLYEQIAKAAPSPIPVEVWLDGAGLVRRMRMIMEVPTGDGNPGVKADMTMELFDFGISPKIDLPSRSEAFDSTPLARAQLHLLDGSAAGIRMDGGTGPALSSAAFRARTAAICRTAVRRMHRLVARGKRLRARHRGNGRSQKERYLRTYAFRVFEPLVRTLKRSDRRLARLSAPPRLRAAFHRYLHFSAVSLEGDLAQTRALELGDVKTAERLESVPRAASRRAKQAARAAKLGAACAPLAGSSS